ncbi:hypothetical protein MBLNU459_g4135t2 [Dothideomycetes sp. NU459]
MAAKVPSQQQPPPPPPPFWTPPLAGHTPMDAYRQHINRKFGLSLPSTAALQRWTTAHPQPFWLDLYSYLGLVPALPAAVTRAYDERVPMSSVPRFFDGLTLNYAQNALAADPDARATALVGIREGWSGGGDDHDAAGGTEERVSWGGLRERVRVAASALRRCGVGRGAVVAAMVGNSVWAVVLFLAAASLGAVFTSINPDLGAEIAPAVIFCDSDSTYKGKPVPVLGKLGQVVAALPSKPLVFVIPFTSSTGPYASISDFVAKASPTDELEFEQVSFSHPLVICYSSGTTGPPKCIVHQHGLVLQLKKISMLHNSLKPGDVVLQYSNTSWVLFYILNGHLAAGATCVCYDGSPMWPDVRQFLRIAEKYRCTYIGSSPRYLLELEMARVVPKTEFDLSALRMINTTGAPLSADQYTWFYNNFPSAVHLSNTAGGTDTATSILASDPSGPLYAGEIQMAALGMAADIADPTSGASMMHTGEPGEMVIRQPFPSMPCQFWGDDGGKLYHDAYFDRFEHVDVWAQHDWLSYNPKTGGFVMHGRSDGVLNPSGIRFGSGEIYGIAEGPGFNAQIGETLCVGRRRPRDKDETVFLFVKMLPGKVFTEELRSRLRTAISQGLSPRHVPSFILEVPDIPVTINGKKVEIAVKQILSGREVKASSTVANPDTLLSYKRFRNLERPPRAEKL